MGAGTVAEPRRASKSKAVTTGGVAANIFRWFVRLGAAAKHILRPTDPACPKSPAEAGAVFPQAENTGAKPTTVESFAAPLTTGVSAERDSGIKGLAPCIPDKQEIERRRDLVRTLFNDFWSGAHDKPVAFLERLDQAEDYVNERLMACGECWQLDAKTRVALGLPPRSHSPNNGKDRVARG
jgi:hypothetical protein